jgi:hypothetical protein
MVNRVMAVASAFLLIVFFIPQRGTGGRASIAGKTAATIFNGQKISLLDENNYKQEWEECVRLYGMEGADAQQERVPLCYHVLGQEVTQAINYKPNSFMILVFEAREKGIRFSNDQLQEVLKNFIVNMPDETDDNYDLSIDAVTDLLRVANLLERVGNMVKVSQPRATLGLAMTEQDEALNVVQIPLESFLAQTSPPTTQEIETQFEKYSETLPGQTQAAAADTVVSPLGFGYKFPNRVKVQFIGFTRQELIDTVKRSRPAVEWEVKARQTYRKNAAVFVPNAGATPPDWYSLVPAITDKVYDQVYSEAANDLGKKLDERISDLVSSDWEAYHEAVARGDAPPRSSQGVPVNTNDYLRLFAASLQRDFGIIPILEIDDRSLLTPADLDKLKYIGQAHDGAGHTFSQCATLEGDQFPEAAQIPESARLSLWQLSPALFTGTPEDKDGYFIFRLTAMDPSHDAKLDEVKDQVAQDVRTQAAWDLAQTAADKLYAAAKLGGGLAAAARTQTPPLVMTTTDYFNAFQNQSGEKIPGLTLTPQSVHEISKTALTLLQTSMGGGMDKPVKEAELPADHEFAVIELQSARANWLDQTDLAMRLSGVQAQTQLEEAIQLESNWAYIENSAKRDNFQEVALK